MGKGGCIMKEVYCDVCDNLIANDDRVLQGYKIIDKNRFEYDDEFIRICNNCEEEAK